MSETIRILIRASARAVGMPADRHESDRNEPYPSRGPDATVARRWAWGLTSWPSPVDDGGDTGAREVDMDEILTVEQIEARYAPEWVLIGEPQTDDADRLMAGKVLF